MTFELIFKMSINGSNCDDFFNYCQNKGPTLLLIKTTKNKIFGGFTPLDWKKGIYGIIDKSDQSFIFSLDLLKKYDIIKKNEYAIRCASGGPNFGNADIWLKSDMKKGEIYANSVCNYLSNNNLELIGGKGEYDSFQTEEFEVYKVIFS